jgi:hypothetical protein
MTMVSTQPLTEMSNRNLPGSKELPAAHKADRQSQCDFDFDLSSVRICKINMIFFAKRVLTEELHIAQKV